MGVKNAKPKLLGGAGTDTHAGNLTGSAGTDTHAASLGGSAPVDTHGASLSGTASLDTPSVNTQQTNLSSGTIVTGSSVRISNAGSTQSMTLVVNVAKANSKVILTAIVTGGTTAVANYAHIKEGAVTLSTFSPSYHLISGSVVFRPNPRTIVIDNPSTGNHTYTLLVDDTNPFASFIGGFCLVGTVVNFTDTHGASLTGSAGTDTHVANLTGSAGTDTHAAGLTGSAGTDTHSTRSVFPIK